MTAAETKETMKKIALDRAAEYGEKKAALDKSAKTEQKALAIAKQTAETYARYLDIEMKERWITHNIYVRGKEYHGLDEYKPLCASLSGDDRESFTMFVFAAVFVRDDMDAAREKLAFDETDVQSKFRFKIVCSVAEEILRAWQSFWDEHGCVPCEVYR